MAANGHGAATVTIEQLRSQFHQRMAGDLLTLKQFAAASRQGDGASAQLSNIRAACHKLSGSAGLFGYDEVARAAGRIQAAAAPNAGAPTLDDAIAALIRQLSAALAAT